MHFFFSRKDWSGAGQRRNPPLLFSCRKCVKCLTRYYCQIFFSSIALKVLHFNEQEFAYCPFWRKWSHKFQRAKSSLVAIRATHAATTTHSRNSLSGGGKDGKRPGATEFEKKRRKKHIPTDPIKFNLITLDPPPLLPSVCRRAKKGKSLKTHVEFAKFAFLLPIPKMDFHYVLRKSISGEEGRKRRRYVSAQSISRKKVIFFTGRWEEQGTL